MPLVSKAQARKFFAERGKKNPDIPRNVVDEFIGATPSVRALPERARGKQSKKKRNLFRKKR